MPTLRVNTGFARDVFEHDRHGEIIPSAESNTFNICICNDLCIPKGTISFHTIVKIDKSAVSAAQEAEKVAIAWLQSELPIQFSQSNYWNFFGHTWLTPINLPKIANEKTTPPFSSEIELTPHLMSTSNEAIAHLEQVRKEFQEAKEKLWRLAADNMPPGFAQTVGEARTLLRTIENVLSASADIGGYESSKARSAMRDYEELARRKVESNHNYQCALHSLQSFAFGVTFPKTWGQRPVI